MITVDAMEKKKPNLIENVKLTQLRKPHIVVQDNYIEALSYAHDSLRRSDHVRFRIVAEFTMRPVFESMFRITDDEESCVVS
jgi:hypothetical protein